MARRWLLLLPALAAGVGVLTAVTGASALLVAPVAGLAGLAVAVVLHRRLVTQRARVLRLLEELPPAILLFSSGLSYANQAARSLFDLDATARGGTPEAVLGDVRLAETVTRAQDERRAVELEGARDERVLQARAVPTATGEIALVVTDLTETRRVEAMRRDFVTNASHELKTPVAGLQALSEALSLAVGRDPARAERMIERMQVEAARLARLVRDLLDLSRLEEAATRPHAHVDVSRVVSQQLERLAPLAAERDITLTVDLPEHVDVAVAPEDLRLIVANLLENAVRYNHVSGEVHVTVSDEGQWLTISVADTGIGIPAEEQERIFERFYRVDKGRSREEGGTGLGLSLVRNAAQRYGGIAAVTSAPGKGSTFTVRLPQTA